MCQIFKSVFLKSLYVPLSKEDRVLILCAALVRSIAFKLQCEEGSPG